MGSAKEEETAGTREGVSDATKANQEAIKAYGAGGNQYGQSGMAYGQQQSGFAQPWQQMGFDQQPNIAFRVRQGMAAPLNSSDHPQMGMYAPPPQHGQDQGKVQGQVYGASLGYSVQNHQYGPPRMVDARYAQTQGVGGRSHGGPPPPPPLPTRQLSRGGGCERGGRYSQSVGGPWM
jgi:hypothetical protein